MTAKSIKKITGSMVIGELAALYPEMAEVLVEDYGFHCIGCGASGMETLVQGAEVHGMTKEEIKVMVKNLNELIKAKK